MSRVAKFLRAGLISIVGIVVLAFVVLLLIPNDTYRRWLEESVSSATGRQLTVAGDFDAKDSLFKVHATDVRFANPDWASDASMVTVGRFDATMRFLPLLLGRIEVALDLDALNVALETRADGEGNWQIGEDSAPPDAPVSGPPGVPNWLLASRLLISNGTISYTDGATGNARSFALDQLDVGEQDQRLALLLKGQYLEQPITLEGDLGDFESLASGAPADLKLDGGVGDIKLSVNGSVAQLFAAAGPTLDLALGLKAPSTRNIEPFVDGSIPDVGAVGFTGRLAGEDGALAAPDLKLTLDGPDLNAGIDGAIGNLLTLNDMAFAAQVSSDTVPALVEAIGITLPGTAPQSFELSGKVLGDLNALALQDLSATLDDEQVNIKLTGKAEDLITQKGVNAQVNMTAPSLAALSKFAGRDLPETGAVEAGAQVNSDQQSYAMSDILVRIAGDDLNGELTGTVDDLVALSGVNLKLDALLGSLARFSDVAGTPMPETQPLEVHATMLAADGPDGPATVSAQLESDWLQGKVDGTLASIQQAEDVHAVLDLELKSVAVLSGLAGRELPPMGPVKASAKLDSQGTSYALTDLDMGIDDQGLKARVTGSIQDLLAVSGVDLGLEARLESLSTYSDLVGQSLPETKPLAITAKAVADAGAQGPAQISATLTGDWLNGKLDTTVADLRTAQGVAGTVSLELSSLADLSSAAGRDLPAMGPIKASAELAPNGDVLTVQKLAIDVEDENLRASIQGSIDDLLALTGIKLDVNGSVDSVSALSALAGTELPQTPPLKLAANVTANKGLQGPVGIDAKVDSNQLVLTAQGGLTDLAASSYKFDLALDAPSLARVGEFTGSTLPDVQPVKVTLTVGSSGAEIDLASLNALIGTSDLTGDAKLTLPQQETRGDLQGIFKSRSLKLHTFIAEVKKLEPPDGAQTASDDGRVFSDTPLPLDMLQGMDAFVELNTGQVEFRDIVGENGRTTADLQEGKLKLVSRMQVGDRPVSLDFELDSKRQPAPVTVKLKADVVPLSRLLAQDAILQGGELLYDLDVAGAGNSVRQIMGGLNGNFAVAVRDTRLASGAFEALGKDILSQVNPMSADRGYSAIECAAVALDIKDGLATTPRGIIIQEDAVTWVGHGNVNLKTEQISLTAESKPRAGIGVGAGMVASLVQISGTLSDPVVTPNPVGVAKKGIEAALAFSTGGMSLLATGLLNRMDVQGDVCAQIARAIIDGQGIDDAAPAAAEQAGAGGGSASQQ